MTIQTRAGAHLNIFGSRLVIVIRIRGFYVKCKGVFAKTRVSSARHSGAAVWDPARRAAAGRLPPTLPPCVPRSLPYFQATTSSSPLWFPHPRRIFLGSAGAIDRDSRGRAAAGDGEGPCHLYLAETAPARSTSVPLLLKLPCLLGSSAKAHAFPPPILPRNRGQDSSPLPRRRRRGGSLPITPPRARRRDAP